LLLVRPFSLVEIECSVGRSGGGGSEVNKKLLSCSLRGARRVFCPGILKLASEKEKEKEKAIHSVL
jgi:hypothetical protein